MLSALASFSAPHSCAAFSALFLAPSQAWHLSLFLKIESYALGTSFLGMNFWWDFDHSSWDSVPALGIGGLRKSPCPLVKMVSLD